MDTGSHLLFGVTLAGLAHLDPSVAQNPALAQAVLAGTLIGSHAPDFDTVMRLKGYSHYIRYHRGITHSIPALFLWPALIAIPLAYGLGAEDSIATLYLWSLLAVVFHVFLDMFNSYGVQCFRPFTRKWIHLDILSIFEPFLFLLHLAGLLVWLEFDYQPGVVFTVVYAVTFGYIGLRALHHQFLVGAVKSKLKITGICHVVPSFHWFHWRFVVETDGGFHTGRIVYNRILTEERYSKENPNPIIEATKQTDGVRTFLAFAQRIHVTCRELQDGYEVSWSDVRFWYDSKLPFGVDVRLDRDLNVVSHSLGWRKRAWDPPFV
ncbi:metal-dependent hydrolase [Effusibacillus lacus]|uniref:Hydrolase n=1 Tax=Effusibacillus lacus TaxID=1348429 RepID=A0A292YK61_9BACL|nr:metal-dependent hydrolase [Effusibacillus lacus]TCS69793.1 inner membrane protein [Effusibacillus lacus]GAX88875.1 hydrolase [Effusibacillus lacus]